MAEYFTEAETLELFIRKAITVIVYAHRLDANDGLSPIPIKMEVGENYSHKICVKMTMHHSETISPISSDVRLFHFVNDNILFGGTILSAECDRLF